MARTSSAKDALSRAISERDRSRDEDPGVDTDLGEEDEDNLPDDDDADDGTGDDSDAADEDTDEDWTPPTREQWEAAQGKLKRARKQAQRLREEKQGRGSTDTDEDSRERSDELERWQVRAVRGDARAALLQRGADPDLVDLALGRLRANEIEFDDDDEPVLDEWLDDMEDRYPRLFERDREREPERRPARKTSRRTTGVDQAAGAGTNGRAAGKPKTSAEMLLGAATRQYGRRSM